jgi:anti-sigma B factor antagonist
MKTSKPIIVQQLPEKLTAQHVDSFFREVQPLLVNSRPQIVFDMSSVRDLDSDGVEMILKSMQHVMKRNGELKLASIPASSRMILELMSVDDLFEIFETCNEAVESFHWHPETVVPTVPAAVPVSAACAFD